MDCFTKGLDCICLLNDPTAPCDTPQMLLASLLRDVKHLQKNTPCMFSHPLSDDTSLVCLSEDVVELEYDACRHREEY